MPILGLANEEKLKIKNFIMTSRFLTKVPQSSDKGTLLKVAEAKLNLLIYFLSFFVVQKHP